MGTWGNIKLSSLRHVESTNFSDLWLVTTHDGFPGDTLKEFLTIPLSIYDRSKLDYENVWSKLYSDTPTEPERYWKNNQGFYFYQMFLNPSYPGNQNPEERYPKFEDFLAAWNSFLFLDISAETMVSFFIWQAVRKWWICPEEEAKTYGSTSEIWVHEGRCPKVTLTIPVLDDGWYEDEVDEYIESLNQAVRDISADYPEGYRDVELVLTEDRASGTITLPIDEIVAKLVWNDLLAFAKGSKR